MKTSKFVKQLYKKVLSLLNSCIEKLVSRSAKFVEQLYEKLVSLLNNCMKN